MTGGRPRELYEESARSSDFITLTYVMENNIPYTVAKIYLPEHTYENFIECIGRFSQVPKHLRNGLLGIIDGLCTLSWEPWEEKASWGSKFRVTYSFPTSEEELRLTIFKGLLPELEEAA